MIKNEAGQVIGAQMVNATTGAAYIGTVTVYVTGDGGIQALGSVGSGVCTAEGNGYYTYLPAQAETNYTLIAFTFIGTGAVPATIQVATVTAAASSAVTATTGVLALTVRSIITDALIELGVLEPGDAMTAAQGQTGLRRVQAMIDSWAADRLTLSLQLRTSFTWPASTSEVQIGLGQTVNIDRPMWINTITYVVPGTSPGVEVLIGQMDEDAYASLSIKSLTSALPQQCFYQTNLTNAYGTLFLWPQPQSLTVVIYTPQAVSVPATLDSVLQGPPGYQDAFLYQLALRLCSPFGIAVPPLLPRLATNAFENMKRPNVDPGALSIDAALVPSAGAGYNVLTDSSTFSGNR
jgi:hypothetical protein